MKSYLESKGYKESLSGVLNNKQFMCTSTEVIRSEELSTFNNNVNMLLKEYQLFLDTRGYKDSVVEGLIDDKQEGTDVSVVVEQQERGYLITLNYTIRR